ncbi:hypothetical protein SEPCBS57363_004929 [Sporothrix epigloea]|uniref:C6 zinc finger domain containing protein n=1 Tax=Sporothrix epigloea TaxID=1892477 RepID=A0ABP0DUS0_9PEZI
MTNLCVRSRARRRQRVSEAPAPAEISSHGVGALTSGGPGPAACLPDEDRFVGGSNHVSASESDLDAAESRFRRLTELRLLQHYMLQQMWTFGQPTMPRPEVAGNDENGDPFIWATDLVGRATEGGSHDSILYALLAHSALSLWVGASSSADERQDQEACAANRLLHQKYFTLALRAQRRAVAALLASPPISPETRSTAASSTPTSDHVLQLADEVGIASLLLVNHSFALVQTLPLDPWQPPHEWLQMGRGAMQVMKLAKAYLGDTLAREKKRRTDMAAARTAAAAAAAEKDHCAYNTPYPSLVAKLLRASPRFERADMFSPVWAAPYLWLLEEPVADPGWATGGTDGNDESEYDGEEPETETETSKGAGNTSFAPYYDTLAYIGWCATASARPGEPANAMCRRLAAAACWLPSALEERLRQRRPRAMVCLAQYFALWVPFEPGRSGHGPRQCEAWMMGSAGRRQLTAIHDALPARWKSKVAPLLLGL